MRLTSGRLGAFGQSHNFAQHAVYPAADFQFLFHRLDMDVAGPVLGGESMMAIRALLIGESWTMDLDAVYWVCRPVSGLRFRIGSRCIGGW